MTIKGFNTKIINQGFTQTDKHIVFQTPDGKVYTDVEIISIRQGNEVICKVKLNDKIEAKFRVGDVVTNISGLYPNVKCTISKVDYDKQCYYYKEVGGITNFEDQDKLMLVNDIKPKFKAGDKVKNVSLDYPDKIFVINIVNTGNQCYHYFNSKSIITYFKDQDKLILVKDNEVPPPVEGDKLDILAKAHVDNVKYNVLKYDIEHYPIIYNALKQIVAISKEGVISYRLVVPMKKEADEAEIYYEEDEVCGIIRWHFDKLGYKIKETIKENEYNEFFITW